MEPSLPLRTSIALGVLAVIGLSWAAFAAWILTRKRILLGRDRVVAGRLAVVLQRRFCVGAAAVGYVTSSRTPLAAAAMGVAMLVIAVTMLIGPGVTSSDCRNGATNLNANSGSLDTPSAFSWRAD